MGRPYRSELLLLDRTYEWAMSAEIGSLRRTIRASSSLPLLAVGSGGSLTAGHFLALLHQRHARRLARAVTPLEADAAGEQAVEAATIFLSASGRNPDILGAFRRAVLRDRDRLFVVCLKQASPLARLAASAGIDVFELEPPFEKDGFLAANSLLAFFVLLSRAFESEYGIESHLPSRLPLLMESAQGLDAAGIGLTSDSWKRQTLVVLYSGWTQPAAHDLESKFTEAALGSTQLSDYRNFAHGRHHWLAKHGADSAVIAIVTDEDRQLADRTLALIPRAIPTVRLNLRLSGIPAAVAALTRVFQLVEISGAVRRIDPGRPGVPGFGRKIYNLKAFPLLAAVPSSQDPREAAAIQRKTGISMVDLPQLPNLERWQKAYRIFRSRLARQAFQGVVFDYDGTLCSSANRFSGVSTEVAGELSRLVRGGIVLGVATGRGKSIKADLRAKLSKKIWSQVVVGYYNGSEVDLLSSDTTPEGGKPTGLLAELLSAIEEHPLLSQSATWEPRRFQISLQGRHPGSEESLYSAVQELVQSSGCAQLTILQSSHSLDILAPGVSKETVIRSVEALINCKNPRVLCVGDRGRWPGNDFALLRRDHALSVDECSRDPVTCWNLAPAGHRGVRAALGYLAAFQISKGALKVRLPARRTGLSERT